MRGLGYCYVHWLTSSDPALFAVNIHDATKIVVFFLGYLLITIPVLTVGTFTSGVKDIKSLRSHNTLEINLLLVVDGRIRLGKRIRTIY